MQQIKILGWIWGLVFGLLTLPTANAKPVTIYTAKAVITMEPSQPRASAVAVQDGRIIGVGTEQTLKPWLAQFGGHIERQLANKIIMPGFIDPHVHPSLPALLTQLPFIAPDAWSLPTGEFRGITSPEAYRQALTAQIEQHADWSIPFGTWGYHELWHGRIRRAELDSWFPDRPVFLWQRSFHEVIANTAALDMLGIDESQMAAAHGEANWDDGHFWETGLMIVLSKLDFLTQPERFTQGIRNFNQLVHRGGVTTAVDMGLGISGDPKIELALLSKVLSEDEVPFRLIMTPIILKFLERGVGPEEALQQVREWQQGYAGQVSVRNHFKLMIDGAIFSALSQFNPPGYLDGHSGVWMTSEEQLEAYASVFWDAGFQLHAHANGDAGVDRALDLLDTLLDQKPRRDHQFTLEHVAYSTEAQSMRMRELGAVVSANPYYHYILSDSYAEHQIGPTRAHLMVRLGSLKRHGVAFTLHSDTPMAPLAPLTLAHNAINRETINGNQTGVEERIDRHLALQAITINAAWIAGMESEIGSIAVGKKADFTILEQDPYQVDQTKIKDIEVWGTVFEGRLAPIMSAQ